MKDILKFSFVVLIVVGSIYLYLSYNYRNYIEQKQYIDTYIHNIKELQDSIESLKTQIVVYESEFRRIDSERVTIIEQFNKVVNEYERNVDNITNASTDESIDILSKYLSEEGCNKQ